jgi:predicted DNA-binding protein
MMEKYTELVQTRLTKDQIRRLEEFAKLEGLKVASLIRNIIIKKLDELEEDESEWPEQKRR